jgi:hypothetical protein
VPVTRGISTFIPPPTTLNLSAPLLKGFGPHGGRVRSAFRRTTFRNGVPLSPRGQDKGPLAHGALRFLRASTRPGRQLRYTLRGTSDRRPLMGKDMGSGVLLFNPPGLSNHPTGGRWRLTSSAA